MTLSAYVKLKQHIEISVGNFERHGYLLATLKNFFKGVINSPRREELINSISDLLTILEIRGVLSEDNVGPLKDIAKILPNEGDLLNKIQEYQNFYISRQINHFDKSHKEHVKPAAENVQMNDYYLTNLSKRKYNRLHETIVDEIGTFWRDFGRALKIRESFIDDIDKNNHTLGDKARKMLDKYLNDIADPQHWFFDLCQALDKARRRDLTKSLQKIMAMNI